MPHCGRLQSLVGIQLHVPMAIFVMPLPDPSFEIHRACMSVYRSASPERPPDTPDMHRDLAELTVCRRNEEIPSRVFPSKSACLGEDSVQVLYWHSLQHRQLG